METKSVTVNIQVQLDIPKTDNDLNEVISALDNINMSLQRESEENYDIQIFTSGIDNSDISDADVDEEDYDDETDY